MSAAKHTPGPWRVRGALDDLWEIDNDTGRQCVATVYGGEDQARLIAAAPDLVADLAEAIREMDHLRTLLRLNGEMVEDGQHVCRRRLAIGWPHDMDDFVARWGKTLARVRGEDAQPSQKQENQP